MWHALLKINLNLAKIHTQGTTMVDKVPSYSHKDAFVSTDKAQRANWRGGLKKTRLGTTSLFGLLQYFSPMMTAARRIQVGRTWIVSGDRDGKDSDVFASVTTYLTRNGNSARVRFTCIVEVAKISGLVCEISITKYSLLFLTGELSYIRSICSPSNCTFSKLVQSTSFK